MEETTEEDSCAPRQGLVLCEALMVLAKWALEAFDFGKMELFPLGKRRTGTIL